MRKTHLWTLVVVAALGGYLAYDLRSEKREGERKEKESRIFDLPADQINEMTIAKGEARLRVQRSVDGWKVVEPFEDRADDFFTDDFVKRLSEEKILGVAKEGAGIQWEVFGLDRPLGSVTFKSQSGAEKTLEISAKKNFEQNSLARRKGEEKALVVNSAWVSHLDRTGGDFRDKRILRAKIADVESLKFQAGREAFDLVRTDNTWSLRDQPRILLDQNRVREVLSLINETQASDVVVTGKSAEAEKKAHGLGGLPLVSLQAGLNGNRSWSSQWGRWKDREYAFISEPLSIMSFDPGTLAKFLALTKDGLRDKKKAFEARLDGAARIEWTTSLKKTVLASEAGQWMVENDKDAAIDGEKVKAVLKSLGEAKVDRYATAAETAGFRPDNVLSVLDGAGKELIRISWSSRAWGKDAGTTRLMKTNLIDEVFHFPESGLPAWSPAELVVKKGDS